MVCLQWKLPLGRLGVFSICQGWPQLWGDAHPVFPCCEDGGDGQHSLVPISCRREEAAVEPGGQRTDQRDNHGCNSALSGLQTGSCLHRQPKLGPHWVLNNPCSALGEYGRGWCSSMPYTICRAAGEVLAPHPLMLHKPPPPCWSTDPLASLRPALHVSAQRVSLRSLYGSDSQ